MKKEKADPEQVYAPLFSVRCARKVPIDRSLKTKAAWTRAKGAHPGGMKPQTRQRTKLFRFDRERFFALTLRNQGSQPFRRQATA